MPKLPLVSTLVTPLERQRLDAAGLGMYEPLHRECFADVLSDIQVRNATAVIVSVARCGANSAEQLRTVIRDFPRVTTMALLSEVALATPYSTLQLGQIGIRTLIDGRYPSGWSKLREILSWETDSDLQKVALERIRQSVGVLAPDCYRFFELILVPDVQIAGVRALAQRLEVLPTTMVSRFFRAGLPAPKRYLAMARLMRAARLFEDSGRTVGSVADTLDYSSPQAFGRHVRTMLNMSPVLFRRVYTGMSMLDHFHTELIVPYAAELRVFRPATSTATRLLGEVSKSFNRGMMARALC
jgi:AraC-like DNA-binding protein